MSHTIPASTTVDLFTQDLRFASRGAIRADERRMAVADTDRRLAAFHAETADDVHPDHWEKHSLADEAVCCLSGAVRLHLRASEPGTADQCLRLVRGQAVIVPRDRWHRFEFEEPTDLLAVTVRPGTKLETRTGRQSAR